MPADREEVLSPARSSRQSNVWASTTTSLRAQGLAGRRRSIVVFTASDVTVAAEAIDPALLQNRLREGADAMHTGHS